MKGGRPLQLRRGLYALAPPYRKARPHPFLVANRLVPGSYVSLQSALAYHGRIPEHVPVTTSVTTGRPQRRESPLGSFVYHHVRQDLLSGYRLESPADRALLTRETVRRLLDERTPLRSRTARPARSRGGRAST